jgi:hypothetical protein
LIAGATRQPAHQATQVVAMVARSRRGSRHMTSSQFRPQGHSLFAETDGRAVDRPARLATIGMPGLVAAPGRGTVATNVAIEEQV